MKMKCSTNIFCHPEKLHCQDQHCQYATTTTTTTINSLLLNISADFVRFHVPMAAKVLAKLIKKTVRKRVLNPSLSEVFLGEKLSFNVI